MLDEDFREPVLLLFEPVPRADSVARAPSVRSDDDGSRRAVTSRLLLRGVRARPVVLELVLLRLPAMCRLR